MIEPVLVAFLLAKIKGLKITPVFKSWAVYPALLFTLMYAALEILIFKGNYNVVPYASVFKKISIVSFLCLIINYNLYKQSLIGSCFLIAGTILNYIATNSNGGKMPVFPTFTLKTGYVRFDLFKHSTTHFLGNDFTKLKWLSDWIDTGYSIMSVGDVLIRIFAIIIVYYSIKKAYEMFNQ